MSPSPTRRERGSASAAWTAAGIVMAGCLLATFTLATPSTARRVIADPNAAPTDSLAPTPAATSSVAFPTRGPQSSVFTGPGGRVYDCAKGQNAGPTDVGVTPNEIRLAATTVESGPAKDFLSDAKFGMLAVIQKVNRAGGICGRQLSLQTRNDEWNTATGEGFIKSFIGDNRYFGLAVNPSSEGLRGGIESKAIDRAGFPAVGADGMLIDQYQDPWVWPVATSTASVMHIMAADAYARGARTFGIAWEDGYRFGVEGHDAFVGAVRRLHGTVNADAKLVHGQNDYSNQASSFIGQCGGADTLSKCDFIAMLLEPQTASQWVRGGGLGNGQKHPAYGVGVPQPLFINSFARDCAKYCAGMRAWTSFKPPLPPFDGDPVVRTYLSDLRAVSQRADEIASNPHVEGAYVGMELLVEALKRLGPSPSRAGIRRILDSMVFDSGLGPTLRFSAGNHFASIKAQAYEDITQNDDRGTFENWRYTNSGFITDTDVGKDIPG